MVHLVTTAISQHIQPVRREIAGLRTHVQLVHDEVKDVRTTVGSLTGRVGEAHGKVDALMQDERRETARETLARQALKLWNSPTTRVLLGCISVGFLAVLVAAVIEQESIATVLQTIFDGVTP